MKITREDEGGRGRYVTNVEGHEAELTFHKEGRTLTIDHVGVPGALEGRGIGTQLVAHAVQEARARNEKLVPLCPFAAAKIGKRPEWKDVLA
ncbi:N-acetyltransferase [Parvularcula sp. ZS-1/3]|uniref:N-acetyltransferase n=1 Tax=Parvularcula mediterranea TaxID=2732508 RepID=A0A7Y3RQU4_9PROT|nr:GNAT family N-acetyltransferase [Parvularcula mediterranea]NNU17697.1 N-acetyltransferase [Parvularcula mediterranea]